MGQAGAQGLAGSEHGRNKAGSLSCVPPIAASWAGTKRVQPAACPPANRRGTLNIKPAFGCGMRRHLTCLVREGLAAVLWELLEMEPGSALSRSARWQRGQCAAAGPALQGLRHSGKDFVWGRHLSTFEYFSTFDPRRIQPLFSVPCLP